MDPIADAIVAGDSWFLEDYYVLLDRLKPGDRVLDLGGHVGTFALAAAALGCRVVCVEAAPRLIRLLRASVARNGFDEVHIVHGAVTDRQGGVGFIPSGPWGTIANPVVEGQPSTIQARTLTPVVVPAVTVDLLLDELRWDRVDVVKLDVEGAELGALRGMTRRLSRADAPVLLYESNSHTLAFFGNTRVELEDTLHQMGYSTFSVEPGRLIPTRPDDLEPQSCINRLALKGRSPRVPGWSVTEPRSLQETIGRVIGQARSPRPFDRMYVARVLAEANAAILTDPRVRLVLWQLCGDADEGVRRAAAWFAPAGLSTPRVGRGRA